MQSPINSIIRQATRDRAKPLNVLTCLTHESYEVSLCLTGHNFWALPGHHVKPSWNESFRKKPSNYHVLQDQKIPEWLDIDLVFPQQKFSHHPLLYPISRQLQSPVICLEHTMPTENFGPEHIAQFNNMRGNINVFISEFSRKAWGFDESNSIIINHAIDTDIFCPNEKIKKAGTVLNVANDFVNRGNILGFPLWKKTVEGLNWVMVGDTKGLSLPSKSQEDLVNSYRGASVFLNCTTHSPIPSVILEAQACGLPIVSTDTAAISEYVENGVSGFLTNDEKELRKHVEYLLANPDVAKQMGNEGRRIMQEKFSLKRFVDSWNEVFEQAANIVYKG